VIGGIGYSDHPANRRTDPPVTRDADAYHAHRLCRLTALARRLDRLPFLLARGVAFCAERHVPQSCILLVRDSRKHRTPFHKSRAYCAWIQHVHDVPSTESRGHNPLVERTRKPQADGRSPEIMQHRSMPRGWRKSHRFRLSRSLRPCVRSPLTIGTPLSLPFGLPSASVSSISR